MAILNIQKVSGVLSIRQESVNNAKSYFGAVGNYMAATDNLSVLINVAQAGQTVPDQYTVAVGDLTVGTSTPSTISSMLVLLNSIFGT